MKYKFNIGDSVKLVNSAHTEKHFGYREFMSEVGTVHTVVGFSEYGWEDAEYAVVLERMAVDSQEFHYHPKDLELVENKPTFTGDSPICKEVVLPSNKPKDFLKDLIDGELV